MQYTAEDLVRLARRDNNSIRPYLYVNPIQGKHIPVDPRKTDDMSMSLAKKVNDAYPNDVLFVIGFAETATGIASAISAHLKNIKYYQNTTREYRDNEEYLYFTESHSHAQDQMLRSVGIADCIKNIDRIVFIDDEVTTGKTICKLIEVIRESYKNKQLKYSIVSVLNSMTSNRIVELRNSGVECIFLESIPFEYKKEQILDVCFEDKFHDVATKDNDIAIDEILYNSRYNPRRVLNFSDYINDNQSFANNICMALKDKHYQNLLVLGTEEFMYPTICVGQALLLVGIADNVRIHSTTRSPIIASERPMYPLGHRYQLRSFYDENRITYVYNLYTYDKVLILTDAEKYQCGLSDICSYFKRLDNNDITLARMIYNEV